MQADELQACNQRRSTSSPQSSSTTSSSKCSFSVPILDGTLTRNRYRRNELKEGNTRAVGRQYYYIDYKHFCDVVKWRIAEMRRMIDKDLRTVSPASSQALAVSILISNRTWTQKATFARNALPATPLSTWTDSSISPLANFIARFVTQNSRITRILIMSRGATIVCRGSIGR
jgi:hypothetical protein